jgi:hypothetical protein
MSGNDVKFSSISVVELLPTLMIALPKTIPGAPIIQVDGVPGDTAATRDWPDIVETIFSLGKKIFSDGGGGGGGGGGGTGCTSVKITNADGTSTTITQCPAPKTA